MREPAPLVTRCRNRTVANTDSITFDVRRWRQCSAGKPKNANSASRSSARHAAAFGYFASNSATKASMPRSASAFVGAYMMSRSARFARGRRRFGNLSSTLASLWHQSRCTVVSGHTSRNADQKPSAPSPIATAGARRPRPRRSRSTLAQFSWLSR